MEKKYRIAFFDASALIEEIMTVIKLRITHEIFHGHQNERKGCQRNCQ